MKFEKIDYYILVNHLTENVGRITKREPVTGYTPADYSNIAIRKKNEWWYVDHIPTGFGIVTIGCKTRAAAFKEYEEHYAGAVARFEADDKKFRDAVELFQAAPTEAEVNTWELVNFCTVRDHRFDKVTDAAKRAGLTIKNADDITYAAGGNVNIIGAPEKLAAIREMIEQYNEMDAAAAIQDAANTFEEGENNMITFTEKAVIFGECTFEAVYKFKEEPAAVIIEIKSAATGREYAPIIIKAGARYYEEARAFVPGVAAETEPAADDAFLTVDDADAEKSDLDFLCDYTEEKPAPKKAREQKTRKPAAIDPAKAARGPVPEKNFIGTTITGKGWRIFFDPEEERTRVIFEKVPTKEVREIVKAAGFYWAPNMGSWNKKLTFKAYRAAVALAGELQDVKKIAYK